MYLCLKQHILMHRWRYNAFKIHIFRTSTTQFLFSTPHLDCEDTVFKCGHLLVDRLKDHQSLQLTDL